MLKLLGMYLPPRYKVALVLQAVILVLIPVLIVVLTIYAASSDAEGMLKLSVCAVFATAALLILDNCYYKKVIAGTLYCAEKAADAEESKRV